MNYNKYLSDEKDTNLKNLIVPKNLIKDHENRVDFEQKENIKEEEKKEKKKYNLTKPRPPIVYKKYPKLNDLIRYLPLYQKDSHDVGDIVKLKNNLIVQMVQYKNKIIPAMFKLHPDDIEYFLKLNKHQRYVNAKWPALNDKDFQNKIQQLFLTFGFSPDKAETKFDANACKFVSENVKLRYYQKIVSTYLIYGPYRGLIAWHGLGSGKTCTSIDAVDKFIQIHQLAKGLSLDNDKIKEYKMYLVLPPVKSLEENFRSELVKCPSIIREAIEESSKRGDIKSDLTNRIINKYINIVSYVSLANKLKAGKINLNNSLLIFDEAHQFLYPLKQFESKYNYLQEKLKTIDNCKILLLTATPIFRNKTDLNKLINILKHKDQRKLPDNNKDFNRKYITRGVLNKEKYFNDIKGYISYYSVEDNKSLFAQKVNEPSHKSYITEDHYQKWIETHKNELKDYKASEDDKITKIMNSFNPNFTNPNKGYFKRSSATLNYPVLSYKRKGIWPDKFRVLYEQIMKYPNEKHFIISRHKEAGANAIGYYLEKQGWTRMSNNRYDHSTPPVNNNKFGELLHKLKISLKKNEISEEKYKLEKAKLIKTNGPKKPFSGFVVLNNVTSQKQIKYSRDAFNDKNNVNGETIRVFIADIKFSEGVSIFNTLHVHLFEPPFNHQTEIQSIARVVRLCGHQDIPPSKRIVRIHKYFASYIDDEHLTNDDLQTINNEDQKILGQIQNASQIASLEHNIENVELDKENVKNLFVLRRLHSALESTQ
jgi:hypothetical protein